jgi:hypothetical protein
MCEVPFKIVILSLAKGKNKLVCLFQAKPCCVVRLQAYEEVLYKLKNLSGTNTLPYFRFLSLRFLAFLASISKA